jgi:hypothetical protein
VRNCGNRGKNRWRHAPAERGENCSPAVNMKSAPFAKLLHKHQRKQQAAPRKKTRQR